MAGPGALHFSRPREGHRRKTKSAPQVTGKTHGGGQHFGRRRPFSRRPLPRWRARHSTPPPNRALNRGCATQEGSWKPEDCECPPRFTASGRRQARRQLRATGVFFCACSSCPADSDWRLLGNNSFGADRPRGTNDRSMVPRRGTTRDAPETGGVGGQSAKHRRKKKFLAPTCGRPQSRPSRLVISCCLRQRPGRGEGMGGLHRTGSRRARVPLACAREEHVASERASHSRRTSHARREPLSSNRS